MDKIDANILFKEIGEHFAGLCFAGDALFVHREIDNNKDIHILLRSLGIDNYFIKEIEQETDLPQEGMVRMWCSKKIKYDTEQKILKEHQKELREAKDIFDALTKQITLERERGSVNE